MKKSRQTICAIRDRFPLSIRHYRLIKNNFLRKVFFLLIFPFALIYYVFLRSSCFCARNKSKFKYDFGIVVIIKNEANYIEEWIEYHKLLGVDKFIIYDNESTDNVKDILNPYIAKGLIDYRVIKGKARQNDAYNDALRRYYKKCKIMAVIDADEFIFTKSDGFEESVQKIFNLDKSIGGVALNWQIYGSSGYEKEQDGYVTKTFLRRAEDSFSINRHIKSVVNPRKVVAFLNPHYPVYFKKYRAVNCSGQEVTGAFSENTDFTQSYIKHYFTKSKDEFLKKRSRGMADNMQIRNLSDFEKHDKNEVYDDEMLSFWAKFNKVTD